MGVNDYGDTQHALSSPPLGGPGGWAESVSAALDGSDETVDARIAAATADLGARITRPNVDDRLVEQWNGSAWSVVDYDSGWRLLDHKALGTPTDPTRVDPNAQWEQYIRMTYDTITYRGLFYTPAGSSIPPAETFVNTFVIGTEPSGWAVNTTGDSHFSMNNSNSRKDYGAGGLLASGVVLIRAWTQTLPASQPIRWTFTSTRVDVGGIPTESMISAALLLETYHTVLSSSSGHVKTAR